MAVGVIFLSLTPGYNTNLMGYLFGDIIMVSKSDLYTTAILSSIVVVVGLLFYKELTAICFDEEFARVKGINVTFYYMLLLCLSALTVVVQYKQGANTNVPCSQCQPAWQRIALTV